jgi:hypothetical protein
LVLLMMMDSVGETVPRYTKLAVPPDKRVSEVHAKGVLESCCVI